MAQGYLRSMGMAEWTPKINASDTAKSRQATTVADSTTNNYKQAESGVITAPKSRSNVIDDDDFDF